MMFLNRLHASLVYWLTICGFNFLLVVVLGSQIAVPVWFLVVPIACVSVISAFKIKVNLDLKRVLVDAKCYWRWIAIAAVAQCIFYAFFYASHYGDRGPDPLRIAIRFSLGPVSNVVEELLFRVTGITLLELWEGRLFGAPSRNRITLITSGSFALSHLPQVLRAPDYFKLFEASNIVFCFYIGVMQANVFYESRNALSVIALHWWVNLQSNLSKLAVYAIAAIR